MPLKHIDDITLQELAQNKELIPEFEQHLNECAKCRENLSFYKNMFPLLSQKLEGDFSPDFAANVISTATIIEERTKKIKSAFSFALIILLSIVPFILFPDSLTQVEILGGSFRDFYGFIKSNISDYNLSSWSILAVVILIIIIQFFEYTTRSNLRKKQYR